MTSGPRRVNKIGLCLLSLEKSVNGKTPRWNDLAALATTAEDVGFDSIWVADRLLQETALGKLGFWEGTTILSALAATTSRVEIGTLVMRSIYRHPTLTAKIVDSIDEISGGRFTLGIGVGTNEGDNKAFGYPVDHRVDRFEEAIEIIHTLLRKGKIDFAGKYYQAEGCEIRPRGPSESGPPIMIAARGPRMLKLTAKHADSWNDFVAYAKNTPGELASSQTLLDDACRSLGRDPSTLERTATIAVAPIDGTDFTHLGVANPIAGSPEQMAQRLKEFFDSGFSHLQVAVLPNTVAGIEAFSPVLERLKREA